MADTIEIRKEYLDALLRRADARYPDQSGADKYGYTASVSILKEEYDYLLACTQNFNTLTKALVAGGVTLETLQILLNNDGADNGAKEYNSSSLDAETPGSASHEPDANAASASAAPRVNRPNLSYGEPASGHHSQPSFPVSRRVSSFGLEESASTDSPQAEKSFNRNEKRTLLFTNLSDRTTHKDIVDAVRGGRLLEVFLRKNERAAQVSFVEGAQEFLNYVKKNDIYVNTKRIDVRWNDRQFHIPTHIANKIVNIGATRNIVIRGGAAKLDEQTIRDDMEHIHNLVIVSVRFSNSDVFISTNSIHNALYARTCMMSRAFYKGFKIAFYPDECAASLPLFRQKQSTPMPVLAPERPGNMYAVLNADASEESEDESDKDASAFGGNGVGIDNWAN